MERIDFFVFFHVYELCVIRVYSQKKRENILGRWINMAASEKAWTLLHTINANWQENVIVVKIFWFFLIRKGYKIKGLRLLQLLNSLLPRKICPYQYLINGPEHALFIYPKLSSWFPLLNTQVKKQRHLVTKRHNILINKIYLNFLTSSSDCDKCNYFEEILANALNIITLLWPYIYVSNEPRLKRGARG